MVSADAFKHSRSKQQGTFNWLFHILGVIRIQGMLVALDESPSRVKVIVNVLLKATCMQPLGT